MSAKLLKESVSEPLVKSGNRWRAVLAVPGQGSSGFYSEEVLREYGPKALSPGAHAYVDHPSKEKPGRSPKDLIGTYPEGAVYEDGVGMVGELEVLPHWKAFVEAVAPHTGLSIYMMGESDEDGNVTALLPDRQNTVDLVSYAGLENSGLVEKLYESARSFDEDSNKPDTKTVSEKEGKMEEKLDKLLDLFSAFITESKTNAQAQVQAEVDATAVERAKAEAVEAYAKAEAAISDAELLPSQVESLRAAALRGEDIVVRIEEAKKIKDEVKASLMESAGTFDGRVVLGDSASKDYTVSGVRF